MANISKLKQVQDKRRAIATRLAAARAMVERLEAQDGELAIAEKVLNELDDEPELELGALGPEPTTPANENAGGKPEGIPTMPDMILEALRDARARGIKGLEPKEITQYIAEKYWPTVTINSVGPIAWRMYSRDKLSKRNSRYSLPKASEETGETNAAA